MGITISGQTMEFLLSAALGFGLGALYDLFRITRVILNPGRIFVFVEDVLYWIICAVVSFLFILTVNRGEIRGFLLFGELMGAVVYYCTLGWLVMKSTRAITAAVRRFFRFLYRLLVKPVKKVLGKCGRLTRKASGAVGGKTKKIRQIMNFRLKRNKVLLYNFFHRTPKKKSDQKDSPER
ncbi:MAG: hypothetical protein HFE85_05155 [Clostridiales bacterium]|nr:hypothetical protein [Clostridiales bacterium]